MIVLVGAILAGIVVALLAFAYNYVRMLNGHQGQETAIQAAALTAGQDISRIVVNSPEFGYVSFSDGAPNGTNTVLPDQWRTPIRSINTLIGTTRLEYIIGQALGDSTMQSMASHDFDTLQSKVVPELESAVSSSIMPNGSATDLNGQKITPYNDAELAFQTNLKKTSGGASCDYVAGSLKLSLGCLTAGKGIATNIPVPISTDNTYPAPAVTPQLNNNYVSEVDMKLGASHFTFASVGASVRLVDQTSFTADNGLTVQIPAVVKAEADQTISNNQKAISTIHAIACATPASVYDPRPAPGALSVSFPDGPIKEVQSLQDLSTYSELSGLMVDTSNNSPKAKTPFANLLTPSPGDYPVDPGSLMGGMAWPLGSATPTMSQVWMCAFYDWVRRAGAKADIGQVCSSFKAKFNPLMPTAAKDWITYTADTDMTQPVDITKYAPGPQIPKGIMYTYKFNKNGGVDASSQEISPMPYNVLAEKQMYAEGVNAIHSTGTPKFDIPSSGLTLLNKVHLQGTDLTGATLHFTNVWDIYIRDECRNYGGTAGGKHGGEPLDDPEVASRNLHNDLCFATKTGVATAKEAGTGGLGAHQGGGGDGAVPLLSVQSDFSEPLPGAPPLPPQYTTAVMYDEYSSGDTGVRPTYTTNGSSIDVRLRRQILVGANVPDLTSGIPLAVNDTGYLFLEK